MGNRFATQQFNHYINTQPIPLCTTVKVGEKMWQTAGQGSANQSKGKKKKKSPSGFPPTTNKSLTS